MVQAEVMATMEGPHRARLVPTRVPRDPSGVVLVLHGGGRRRGDPVVSPTQPSVLRMIPLARRIAHTGGQRLAVYRLLNSTRGWDAARTPVADARWALAEISARLGGALPTVLVGHSLGGRAALLAGGARTVAGVVALNPFVYPDDGAVDLSGRSVLVVHGTSDRVADPERAEQVADALARRAQVRLVRVVGGKHAMVGRRLVFDRLAADFAAVTLLGRTPEGLLAEALAGRRDV